MKLVRVKVQSFMGDAWINPGYVVAIESYGTAKFDAFCKVRLVDGTVVEVEGSVQETVELFGGLTQ